VSLVQSIRKDFGGVALAIIISVAGVVAYVYMRQVDLPNYEWRLDNHRHVLDGTAVAPYRYRIFVPLVCEALMRLFSVALPFKYSFVLSFALYDAAAILFFFMVLFAWLRTWFSRERSLVGLLFVAAVIPMVCRDHSYQPWSLLEPGLFTAGLLAIHRRRHWLLALITAVATLNRETAIFIPLAFFFSNVDLGGSAGSSIARVRKWPILCAGYIFIWAFVYGALRVFRGATPHMYTLGEIWTHNMDKYTMLYSPGSIVLFLGAFWAFAAMGYRHAPIFLKRVAWITPLYVITIVLFGMWNQVRLLMPLYSILVPLGLSYVYRNDAKAAASTEAANRMAGQACP